MAKTVNYLVFQSGEPAHDSRPMIGGQVVGPAPLFHYSNPIAVRAKGPVEACQAVMARTRQIAKYAVIEAEFIDFTAELFEDAEPDERPQLLS